MNITQTILLIKKQEKARKDLKVQGYALYRHQVIVDSHAYIAPPECKKTSNRIYNAVNFARREKKRYGINLEVKNSKGQEMPGLTVASKSLKKALAFIDSSD